MVLPLKLKGSNTLSVRIKSEFFHFSLWHKTFQKHKVRDEKV